jgi:hypothetical protein
MDMTFQFGGGNVSLSVCMAAEQVLCGFSDGVDDLDGDGSGRQRRRQ